jgi:LacI family transcriptional regulator
MRALGDLGLRVPQDISVCSIDDFPWASAFQPALTVVQQPIAEMAGAAFRALLARLGGEEGPPVRQLLAPHLVVRQSCIAVQPRLRTRSGACT